MDFNALVEEIVARVAQKIDTASECEAPECKSEVCAAEACQSHASCPKLLVLTQSHGTHCHEMLESVRLNARYNTECALAKEYACDVSDYEAVILYNVTNEILMKIAEGNGDTPYTSLAVRAILMGKKVVAVREEVELFDYKATAPAVYYGMMMDKVKLLERSGVVFCERCGIEDAILGEKTEVPKQSCEVVSAATAETKEVSISKKVIAEKDITAAHSAGATVLRVSAKAIVTDLAKDYAHDRRIEIIKG